MRFLRLSVSTGMLAGLFISSYAFADSQFYTGVGISGNQLATICSEEHHQANDAMWTVCVSYIDGIIAGYTTAISTAMTFHDNLKNRPELGDSKSIESLLFVLTSMYCIPASNTRLQNAEEITKYLKEHPSELNYPANEVVMAALTQTWPCKK